MKYTPSLGDKVCDLISEGKSMRQIGRMEDMPDRGTLLRWEEEITEFAAKCARARIRQADYFVEETIEIADDPELDPHDKKVRIAARQWAASKREPKKYGDRQTIEHEVNQTNLPDYFKSQP